MRSRILFFFMIVLLVVAVACAGGSISTTTNRTTNTQGATGSVTQISLGDDPSDRVASLSLTLNAVTLTSDGGATVSLVSSPTTLEISSLAGTTTPLGTVTVPVGNYTKLTLTLGGATITVVDPSNGTSVQKTFPAPPNPITINLNPAFVSDGSARVINVDLDLHGSVAIDASGNISFNPLFLASHGRLMGPGAGEHPNPFTGGLDRAFGTVKAVSGSSFTITTAIGQRTLTFTTNSSTIFKGVSGVGSLLPGMLVMVGGQAQADGPLLALGVAVVDELPSRMGALGIVAKTTGTPVTQFTLLAQGVTMSSILTGLSTVPQGGITVNVSSTTHFEPDSDDVDLGGLSLTFDANSLSPAQTVAVNADGTLSFSGNTMMGSLPVLGTLTASKVRLVQQPLTGTISNLSTTGFTLTLPADGAFATLAQTNTVTVYRQTGTMVKDNVALANGQKVVVRGLLFNNSGYKMVATRVVVLQ